MTEDGKKLSNPFSTGSGGARFEANIQATFVTLMLSGGYAPCLPAWPIVEIKLQGMVAGYATDDLIVFIENPASSERRRLLGQVKHSIAITAAASNEIFKEVVQAAWSDFNNPDAFTKGKDVIALITGPISATDTDGVNGLLDQARLTRDAEEFRTQVGRANFCSDKIRNKLVAFQAQLKIANNGKNVPDEDLYEFLKHFHLLGYDLARKGSVVSSLLQSHIAQFNKDIPDKIWYQIVSEVQEFNQNAGTVTIDTLSEGLIEHFREPVVTHIPMELTKEEFRAKNPVQPVATNWSQHASAPKLAMANLIGSWNESKEADIEVVTQIVGDDYSNWIADLRETLQIHDCPLAYKNGLWSFKDRSKSWQEFGGRIFDSHLETFKAVVLDVLRFNDPSFELPGEERYAAAIHGKVLPHSGSLREGIAETLALIGSRAASLVNCTEGNAETTALLSVRELLEENDWIRWGSLNSLLPLLSEASPDEFLSAVENAIAATPSPFDSLFEQEDTGVFGRNYITGLLWALEGIAWEEDYLSRTAVVLAEIASHDPGGNWANRPINSLTDIFLPWLPHTLASVQKRQVVLKTICAEQPKVGWKLLKSLLPNQHSTTSGTHKPQWRETIPDDWEKGVTHGDYWEQSRFCAELIVEQAGFDIDKLASLAGHYDHLPSPASEALREKLASENCVNLPENERMPLWSALCKFIARHRRFPEAEWSLVDESLLPLEEIANQLAPKSPSLLHKRLFSEADSYLYEGDGDWEEEQAKLFEMRKAAVKDILVEEELPMVIEFALVVSNSHLVGEVLADFDQSEIDTELLPDLLDMSNHKQWAFVSAYAWRRRYMGDWQWFDDVDKTEWNPHQVALLLCALPFDKNAWDRASQLLGENEGEYWKNTSANTYQTDDDTEYALVKLLEFGRPSAAIGGFRRDISKKKDINPDLACDALLALVQSEEPLRNIDSYQITKIIKALQENSTTDQDKLFHVEWAYVNLFDQHREGSPITLENRLASDPSFFCELIQLIYRAKGVEPKKEPSEQRRNLATNAYRLLSNWSVVPGSRSDSEFDTDLFIDWLNNVEEIVKASGHYDVAMIQLGNVLLKAPGGPDGLWIHPVIAEAMNDRDRSSLRDGYRTGIFNSRGVHWVDPEGKPEKKLAKKFRQRAEDVENVGYQRLATTLREVAEFYDREAERIISNGGMFH